MLCRRWWVEQMFAVVALVPAWFALLEYLGSPVSYCMVSNFKSEADLPTPGCDLGQSRPKDYKVHGTNSFSVYLFCRSFMSHYPSIPIHKLKRKDRSQL